MLPKDKAISVQHGINIAKQLCSLVSKKITSIDKGLLVTSLGYPALPGMIQNRY